MAEPEKTFHVRLFLLLPNGIRDNQKADLDISDFPLGLPSPGDRLVRHFGLEYQAFEVVERTFGIGGSRLDVALVVKHVTMNDYDDVRYHRGQQIF